MTRAVSVFAFVVLIADLAGVDPLRSLWSNSVRMEGWISVIHLWALYMSMAGIFGSGERGKVLWRRWLNLSLFIAAVAAVYGLFQLFGLVPYNYQIGRLDSTFGNPACMAEYMLIHIFIAVYLFVGRPSLWLYPVMALLFTFEIFETATRGAILGLVGGILIALAWYAIFGKKETKKSRLISGGIVGLMIIIGIVFFFTRTAPIFQKNYTLSRLAAISWSNTSDQARQYLWPIAVTGITQKPILGWGQEDFNYVFNANYNPAMYAGEQWFDRAHDAYLDWAIASGLAGLMAYLALYGLFVSAVWKSAQNAAQKSSLLGLITGYAIFNVFFFDTLASYAFFFALLAFVDSFHSFKSFDDRQLARPKEAVEYVLVPIITAVLFFVIYFFNVRPILASAYSTAALNTCSGNDPDIALFRKALDSNAHMAEQDIRERLLACALFAISNHFVSDAVKREFLDLAVKETKDQIASTPQDARPYALGGAFLNQVGDYAEAEVLLVKAHELMPAKETISLELTLNYLYQNENDQALALLKRVYESAPGFDKGRTAYAIGLVIAGDDVQAENIPNVDKNLLETAEADVSGGQYEKAVTLIRDAVASPESEINSRVQQARVLYSSGKVSEAIDAMRSIESDHPEYKDQIEAAIRQIGGR
jgi:O-antigen ligase/Flp pilus assembly protein TadD